MRINKAHTATANRIARRYRTTYNDGDGVDVQTDSMNIVVETSASILEGIKKLRGLSGKLYVAVTNREALAEALRQTEGTAVGVMDPQGEVVRDSTNE